MNEKKYYWLKLKDDFFTSKEIKKLRRIAGGDTYTVIYLKMQLLSIKSDGLIVFDGTEENLVEQLSLELDEEPENISVTLSFMQANRLIEKITDDEYLLNKVPESIGKETSAAERMRKLREKRNNLSLSRNNVQTCYTEIEIEKEIEIEIDKEIDIADKSTKPPKSKYGELKNVLLTAEEYGKLKERFPDYEDRINKLGYYISSKGKKYNSHYATVLNWARKDEDDDKQGAGSKSKQDNAVSKYNLSTNIS